jgi:radical SAM protein with 4Fe4S-binding SPASM domain
MKNNAFLQTKECLTIIKGKNGRLSLLVSDTNGFQRKYIINDIAAEIINYFGSEIPLSIIISQMYDKYGTTNEEIFTQFEEFFNVLKLEYGVSVDLVQDFQEGNRVEVQYINELYPNGAFIEIIDKCNLKCIHCYGGFDNQCSEYMSLENFKKLADDLTALNVTSLELSGGEITLHPNFIDIIKYALSSDFGKINLITNGTNISDELLDIIAANKERFIIQLDLHGITDEYLEWFMGAKHFLDRIKKNIIKVANVTPLFRVATIVTRKNLYQIAEIADWVYGCGVRIFGVSLVVPMGRALECGEDDLFLTPEEVYIFKDIVEKIQTKYPNFISVIDDNPERKNCGCLTNCVGIKPNGDIKFCAMDTGTCLANPIGNVLTGSIKTIYKQHETFFNALAVTQAPLPDSGVCHGCEHLYFCSGCIVRAFTMTKKLGSQCKWNETISHDVKKYIIA